MNDRKTSLKRLTLRNFRRFEEITLELDERLTLLVAENGGGKTAMLDGIALALWDFERDVLGIQHGGFSEWDVRRRPSPEGAMVPMLPVSLDAEGTIYGHEGRWRWELRSIGGRTKHLETRLATDAAEEVNYDLGLYASKRLTTPPTLPVVRYFGTGRLWLPNKLTQGKKDAAKDLTIQVEAYRNCLSSSSSYREFEVWFESVVREAQNEQATKAVSPHKPQVNLAAVRQAIECVLGPSRWKSLDWDFLTSTVVAVHDEYGRLPVSWLSDGVRNLIALVGDLAYRAVRLNPHLGAEACVNSPGIVLIDEVDMHLHPSWQQQVVGLLQRAFPKIQFVLSSHSPQVISTVSSECIRMIGGDAQIRRPTLQMEGADAPLALADVFGVDSTPPIPIAEDVAQYRRLVEDGHANSPQACALWSKIRNHFGPHHPVVIAAESLVRIQALRARQGNRT